jgi:hypothetical protein
VGYHEAVFLGLLLLLFLIYIDDVDDIVVSKVLELADDTKLNGTVANQRDIERLQKDLKNLCNWSKDWRMLFSVETCQVMHVGNYSMRISYKLEGRKLAEVMEERYKDLGVIMPLDLKRDKQCSKAVNTKSRLDRGVLRFPRI